MNKTRLAGVALLTATSLAGCGELLDYGCSARDRTYSTVLDDVEILAVHPEGAEEVGASSGCDEDDGFAHAGRNYRSSRPRAEIIEFYREAAEKDGWQWEGDGSPPPSNGLIVSAAATCLTKQIDGATAYLTVWFPSDFNGLADEEPAPLDEYGLSLTGSHDGDAWC